MFPFSFKEYCQYYSDVTDKDKLFDEYSFKGGLAGSYAYPNDGDKKLNLSAQAYDHYIDAKSQVRGTPGFFGGLLFTKEKTLGPIKSSKSFCHCQNLFFYIII